MMIFVPVELFGSNNNDEYKKNPQSRHNNFRNIPKNPELKCGFILVIKLK